MTDAAFEARWSAWLQRGAANDRAVRARMRIVLPLFAGVIAALFYGLMR
jgi:hypothetical protein